MFKKFKQWLILRIKVLRACDTLPLEQFSLHSCFSTFFNKLF